MSAPDSWCPRVECDDLPELVDRMESWQKREAAAFTSKEPLPAGGPSRSSSDHSVLLSPAALDERRLILYQLNLLMSRYKALDDVPVALTLLDSLRTSSGSDYSPTRHHSSREVPWTCPKLLTTLVRITLKCTASSESLSYHLYDREVLDSLQEAGGVPESESVESWLGLLELQILGRTRGRVRLTSAVEWAEVIVQRLLTLPKLPKSSEEAVAAIYNWAWTLTQYVPATDRMPPRCLGLAACLLGFAQAGAVDPLDFLGDELCTEAKEASLLMQLRHREGQLRSHSSADSDDAVEIACCSHSITVKQLSWAACCDAEALYFAALAPMTLLQMILYRSVHPQLVSVSSGTILSTS